MHGRGSRDELASAYRRSIEVADELGARTVAFPLISAGVYGWPLGDAARVAVETLQDALARVGTTVQEARIVAFSPAVHQVVERALNT